MHGTELNQARLFCLYINSETILQYMPEAKYWNETESREKPKGLAFPTRREFIGGTALLVIGAVAGACGVGLIDQETPPADYLSEADYHEIVRSGEKAKARARILQAQINATIYSEKPVSIPVLDGNVVERDGIGNDIVKIYRPILLAQPPTIDEVDRNFWFGIQYPDPGGIGKPPIVKITAKLFDPNKMSLSFFVPEGQNMLAASQLDVLVMPPDPGLASNGVMVAYAYNEYAPDNRQRRPDDKSQLLAPGLQIALE